MILDTIDPLIYFPENIQQGFQTPTADKFISYVIVNSHKTSVTPVKEYSKTSDNLSSLLLYENLVQIDFFSDDNYSAPNNANILYNYLTSFAADYLFDNYPDISIGEVEEVHNFTESNDKAKYLFRYMVRFTLFTHEELIRIQDFTDQITFQIDLI
jgi:hypothetical protein